eukprot:jgi/Bigna1/135068/aug1.27_g9776
MNLVVGKGHSKVVSNQTTILFVSSFSVATIRKATLFNKASLDQRFSLLHLEELKVLRKPKWNNNSKVIVRLQFPDAKLIEVEDIELSEMICALIQSVLRVWKSISYGFPGGRQPSINVPSEYLVNFTEPEPDVCDGILATYLASCCEYGVQSSPEVLEYFLSSFSDDNHMFDLGDCLGTTLDHGSKKAYCTQLVQIAAGLKFTDWFDEFVCIGFPILDEGLTAFSTMYKRAVVTNAVLVQSGVRAPGATSLGNVLALGQHNIRFLNLSKNQIGDQGLKMLVKGLSKGRRVVPTLCFQNCGITSAGIKSLMNLLSKSAWMREFRALDISDNRIKKDGSVYIANWLSETSATALHLKNCELDTEQIFQAIINNSQCALEVFNISGNKITKTKEILLARVLQSTTKLKEISLRKIHMTKRLLPLVLSAAFENKNNARLSIDLSECGVGESGSKIILDFFSKKKRKLRGTLPVSTNISSLDLSGNALGGKGICNVIDALLDTDIEHLALDRNFRSSFFSSTNNSVGEALRRCMTDYPSLKGFSIVGDDSSHLGKIAFPMLKAIAKNTSLTRINLASNRLGDEGLKILAGML